MDMADTCGFVDVIDEICGFNWSALTEVELTNAAWAYYHFSIQFRESLDCALAIHPDDDNLRSLAREECNTSNLSPWPGIAAAGERMNHDTFMERALSLESIETVRQARLQAAGQSYLAATRRLDNASRAMSIASYEDGGLERVFHAVLSARHWTTPLLGAFRHFLSEHIRFDSDPSQGHGALARHLQPDDRVLPLWLQFRDLFVACVPTLAACADRQRAA